MFKMLFQQILLKIFRFLVLLSQPDMHFYTYTAPLFRLATCALRSHMWVVAGVSEQFQVISLFQFSFWRPPLSFCLGCLVYRPDKHSYHPETSYVFLDWIPCFLDFRSFPYLPLVVSFSHGRYGAQRHVTDTSIC